MSQMARRIAFVLLLVVAASRGLQQRTPAAAVVDGGPPDVQLTAGLTIVEGWCSDICDAQCPSGCAQARTVGCTCYWICEDQDEGSQICTGSVGVKICAN